MDALPKNPYKHFNQNASQRFSRAVLATGLGKQELCDYLSRGLDKPVAPKTVYRWENDEAKIPAWALLAVEHLATLAKVAGAVSAIKFEVDD